MKQRGKGDIAHLEQGLSDLVDAAEDDGGEEHLRERGCGGLYGGHHRAAGEVNHRHVEEKYCNTSFTHFETAFCLTEYMKTHDTAEEQRMYVLQK